MLACAAAQLVTHPNGAVTPVHHANFAATAAHLATKGYLGVPYYYGKRSAEADPALVYHANGAITPYDPANAAATAAHLASKGHHVYAGYPYAVYGKRSAEADAQHLITYANGAVVPADYNNLAATSAHLATHHYAGYPYVYGKRSAEADPQLLYALPYAHVAVVPGLVAHPNGAVVPVEPADVRQSHYSKHYTHYICRL